MRRLDSNGPVDLYREYGDRRPSTEQLYGMFERAADHIDEDRDTLCVMGDMCIDLAMNQPDDANDWLKTADETLEEAYTTTMDMHERGYTVNLSSAVQAQLRRSELPRWREVVSGIDPTPPDYLEMLDLVQGIVPLTKPDPNIESGNRAASIFREYIPLLLGARAMAFNLNGWQGRLSLDREDCRPLKYHPHNHLTYNPNWDTGVMRTNTAESFIFPEERLQIKAFETQGLANYRRAGVKPIIAEDYGFLHFDTLISKLIAELDIVTSSNGFSPRTQELNTLSGKLRHAVNEPLRRS